MIVCWSRQRTVWVRRMQLCNLLKKGEVMIILSNKWLCGP